MRRIAKFHKVSPAQFAKDWKDTFPTADEKEILSVYENIRLPLRATAGSAGYDFFAPVDITLAPGETAKIPTGIRVEMEQDWVLKCYPRSGLGFKFRLQLIIQWESLTVIISIRIMKVIFSQRSQMTATKIKLSALQPVQALCRESL